MTTSDLTSGYATITAVAALANPRNIPGSKKKIILDAEIFVGGKKCETLLGALSFYNKNNINFEHSGVALYFIYSTIARMDDAADIHSNDLSPEYYDFVGDIQWIIPLSVPSEDDEPEKLPLIDPEQRAYVHVSGYAANCSQRDATFDLDISQYVSTVVPASAKSGSKTKPTSSFACTVLDSPRYHKYGKPVPYARRYVSVTGFLTDTILASESEPRKIKKFFVEVDNIIFGPAGSATGTTLANNLDTPSESKTPARVGGRLGLLSHKRKASESPAPETPSSSSAPSTPTPAQAMRATKRRKGNSDGSAGTSVNENVTTS